MCWHFTVRAVHYSDVIMTSMASLIASFTTVYSTAYSGADQTKHQSSASLAFVRGIHRWAVNSPHKRPVTQKMFPFDDVIIRNDWLKWNPTRRKFDTFFSIFGNLKHDQQIVVQLNGTSVLKIWEHSQRLGTMVRVVQRLTFYAMLE